MKKEDRIKVWEKYEHHCAYCGREIKLEDMQIDHFIPKNRGNYSRWSDKEGKYIVSHGEDSMENYMPSCRACNFRKRDMSIGQFREAIKEQAKGLLKGASKFQVNMSIAYGLLTPSFDKPIVFYFEKCMNYKDRLTKYIQGRLYELSNVDDYEPNKLALTNLLWFLGKVTSNEVIVAKLKIMSDADRKRKKYLYRYDGNESLYDDEYSKAVSTIAKESLTYLQNKKEYRMTNEEFCKANIGKRVLCKGKDIGAYVAGYIEDKYIILGFDDYTGCILCFTSKVKNICGIYKSCRFAKLKYWEVIKHQ